MLSTDVNQSDNELVRRLIYDVLNGDRFTCSATHAGEWQGQRATGRRFENVDEVYF